MSLLFAIRTVLGSKPSATKNLKTQKLGSGESIYWTFLKNLALCFEHRAANLGAELILRLTQYGKRKIPTLEKGFKTCPLLN
jgi:hypothetical protein